VEIPAVLEAAELQAIHPKRNAQITSVQVRHGDIVAAGQTIATLRSSDIEEELNRARISLRLVELRFARRLADALDREGSLVLESSITALRTKIAGLENEQAELTLKAPFDGRIVDLNVDVQPGRWVSPRDMVAIVAGGMGLVAKGYVAEADVGRIEPGAAAWFIPEHPVRERVDLRVERIATAGATQIEIAELASVHSGPIHVSVDDRRRLLPATAQYQVTLTMAQSAASTELAVRGLVIAEGRAESVLARVWRRTLSVLVRESGA
jgi:putative peptide zinc metalloprotease protein